MKREYYYDLEGHKYPDMENMAAYLLDESVLFVAMAISRREDSSIQLMVRINDYFVPGADSECLEYHELPRLFDLYKLNGVSGVVEFVAKKRGISIDHWKTKYNR